VKKTAPRGLLWALHATEDPLSRALQRFFRQSQKERSQKFAATSTLRTTPKMVHMADVPFVTSLLCCHG
jgi:hypothetical protein